MKKNYTAASISLRIWLFTAAIFAMAFFVYVLTDSTDANLGIPFIAFIASLIGSIPALIGMLIIIPFINASLVKWTVKFWRLLLLIFLLTIPYALLGAALKIFAYEFNFGSGGPGFVITAILISSLLFACSSIPYLL